MKYIVRLAAYVALFALVFSISSVVAFRFVPVTITPLKFIRLLENRKEYGSRVDSRWRPLDRISGQMVRAVVASEDNNFMDHSGFDWEAIRKAIEYNKKQDKKTRGASTISQQTAKNVFCTPRRTWLRKGVESYYTVLIELMWGKRRIMEVYLNVIEVHPNVYGAESAARRFYDKTAANLNIYEASMIACVLPSPRRMNIGSPTNYMNRRSARIRTLMGNLPPLEITQTEQKPKKDKKKDKK